MDFMYRIPDETLHSIGWVDPRNIEVYKKELKDTNTTALLKLYGQLKYQEDSMKDTFNRLCKVVEKEFVKKNILLKNEDFDNLKQVVAEVFAEMIMKDMSIEEDLECCKFIVIIHQYVEQLKMMPHFGAQYFYVLNETYLLNSFNLSSEELLQKVGMPRTTYYRFKNQAISALSSLIWK